MPPFTSRTFPLSRTLLRRTDATPFPIIELRAMSHSRRRSHPGSIVVNAGEGATCTSDQARGHHCTRHLDEGGDISAVHVVTRSAIFPGGREAPLPGANATPALWNTLIASGVQGIFAPLATRREPCAPVSARRGYSVRSESHRATRCRMAAPGGRVLASSAQSQVFGVEVLNHGTR
jgi:hypothetical protein